MSVDGFIDTNIFLYHLDDSDKKKHAIADDVIRTALETRNACISHQVVQECLNAGLRKAAIPLDHATAAHYLETVLAPLWRIMPSQRLYQRGIDIQARYRYGFYDSLIIAAALDGGCSRLYSEDLQHGQQIERVTILNPFSEICR